MKPTSSAAAVAVSRASRQVRLAPAPHRGVTLLEIVVVMAILGIIAGVVGMTIRPPTAPDHYDIIASKVARARREAITRGVPVTVEIVLPLPPQPAADSASLVKRADQTPIPAPPLRATALPDGSIIADSALGIDRLAGRTRERVNARQD